MGGEDLFIAAAITGSGQGARARAPAVPSPGFAGQLVGLPYSWLPEGVYRTVR